MRTLIAFILFTVCAQVHAEAPSAKVSTTLTSEAGDAGLTTQSSAAASSTTVSVDASSGSYYHKTSFRIGFDQVSPDYGRYLLTDKNGNITPLSKTFSATESVARGGVDIYVHDFTFSLDGSQTASTTPFAGYIGKFSTAYVNYPMGAKYSLGFARADHEMPTSYFINPETFQTELRPLRNLEDRVTLAWEQILTEKSKAKIEIFDAERPENRPADIGAEASYGYALSDYSALLGKLGIAHENRGAILYDDRGYFDATWAQLEYRIEPTYNWSLSAIFDTILEHETARGIYPEQKIGTDSVALEARTRGKLWDLGLKALGSYSNTNYRAFQMGVDLAWQI